MDRQVSHAADPAQDVYIHPAIGQTHVLTKVCTSRRPQLVGIREGGSKPHTREGREGVKYSDFSGATASLNSGIC